MGDVEIVAVQDKQSSEQFLELPYRLYRHHPYWVPPLRIAQRELLNTKKHPFYAHADMQCFLARRDGQVCGRVAAIVDRNYNEFQKEDAGFFGFFESTDDLEVARAVMQAARKWLLERGAKSIRGPMNPSTNYECGLLVEGFDSIPNVMMPYNSPSYPRMLEAVGLRKAKDLLAYWSTPGDVNGAKVERVARLAAGSQGVAIRTIRMRKFDEEAQMIWKLYNDTWARNWGFVPMTREEFLHEAAEMKQILKPEFVLVGEVEGRNCILVDDLIDTAGTLVKGCEALLGAGARSVTACATHAVLSGEAVERIAASNLKEVVFSDSIPLRPEAQACSKIRVLSVARLLARAIQSIHEETSVSTLFV